MRAELLIWYWRNGEAVLNFGEHVNAILLHSLGYRMRNYDDAKANGDLKRYRSCLLIIGSELHKQQIDYLDVPEVSVWGQGKGLSGVDYDFDPSVPPYADKVRIYAVRGPYTARQLDLPPTVPQGDPAFLLPYLSPITRVDDGRIRYAPHHRNRLHVTERLQMLQADTFFDVMIKRGHALPRIRELISSRFVLTNSLHCAIVAHAYGVPWALSLVDGEKLDMPAKWHDVSEFLGIHGSLTSVKNYREGWCWWHDVARIAKCPPLLPLLDSFPYPSPSKAAENARALLMTGAAGC